MRFWLGRVPPVVITPTAIAAIGIQRTATTRAFQLHHHRVLKGFQRKIYSHCTLSSSSSPGFIGHSDRRPGGNLYSSSSTRLSSSSSSSSFTSSSNQSPEIEKENEIMSSTVTTSHYETHTTESYEQAYFYEPGAYQQYLVNLVCERLQLQSQQHQSQQERRTVLDIGGGTGNFAQALIEQEETISNVNFLVVDPFLVDPEAKKKVDEKRIQFVKAPAEAFLEPPQKENQNWRMEGFHQVLLKEVVHHLEDRVGIFRGMNHDLVPMPSSSSSPSPPSLLIITRPQVEIDYPLWDEARQVWKDNQPSLETLTGELQQAGFVDISHSLESYPCSFALKRWQNMIQQRMWSTFSHFTDEELVHASETTIPQDYQDRIDPKTGIIRFEDRLLFITARKPEI